jgi:hypothetical protein
MAKWICKKCKNSNITCTIQTTSKRFVLADKKCPFLPPNMGADFVQVKSKQISKE